MITLREDGLIIDRLDVPHREVRDFVAAASEAERDALIVQAVRLGVFCMAHTVVAEDTEYVRREVDRVMARVEAVSLGVTAEAERLIREKVGAVQAAIAPMLDPTNKGSVQEALREAVRQVTAIDGEMAVHPRSASDCLTCFKPA